MKNLLIHHCLAPVTRMCWETLVLHSYNIGSGFFFFKKSFINVSLFLRERERETDREWGRGREREGDTESEAGSRLCAVHMEPYVGLEPMSREIMT